MTWNDFEKNYKFKGFTQDQFKAYSNNYSKFTGKHVSDDNNHVVVRVAWNNIIKTRYGFAMIIDRNHVVFGKNWQLWGNGQWNEDIVVSFNVNSSILKNLAILKNLLKKATSRVLMIWLKWLRHKKRMICLLEKATLLLTNFSVKRSRNEFNIQQQV